MLIVKNPCFPFRIKISKCSGSRKNIIDPYAKLHVPDAVTNFKVKKHLI